MNINKEQVRRQLINMYLLAMADGVFDEKEQLCLVERATESGLDLEELFDIIKEANNFTTTTPPEPFEEKIKDLYDLAQIIWSDGEVKPQEKNMLISFIQRYGFIEENSEDIANYLLEEARKGSCFHAIINAIKNTVK